MAIGGGVIAVGAHLSSYEAGEVLVWRTTHQEPGVIHTHNLEVLHPVGDGSAPTETPLEPAPDQQPTIVAEPAPTPTAAPTPTMAATPTAAIAAPPVLADVDEDSSDGGIDPLWGAVIIAELALIAVVIAYFLIRRKPDGDAGRYTS